MKEKDLISTIKTMLNSSLIGDDCAFLQDLGIVVTQDSLVEDVHFSLNFITAFQLGYKSVMVNVSDIAASGGECKYLTISLSLPKNIDDNFVKEFYKGAKKACGNSIRIVGGDITGSDKLYISVCAIGATKDRNISSRANAKTGYNVVVSGIHGSSYLGLKILQDNSFALLNDSDKDRIISYHLEPVAQVEFGQNVGEKVKEAYAMMDTSDGLMDALSTIANESGVLLEIDFDKIPHDNILEMVKNWKEMVLFGGEDYGIVAVIPQGYDVGGVVIGQVKSGSGVDLKIGNTIKHYSKDDVDNKLFNHFDF